MFTVIVLIMFDFSAKLDIYQQGVSLNVNSFLCCNLLLVYYYSDFLKFWTKRNYRSKLLDCII